MRKNCDVLVCGAGISGLLLAAELSQHLDVVVLERNPRSACSMKFWFTSKKSLESNRELAPYVDSEWNEMDFISSTRTKFTIRGEYILWNTRRLQAHLIDTIIANGGKILYGHRFYSYHYTNTEIVSHADGDTFHSSLLVDCMGFSSPIVRASGLVSILGYHHVYGKVLKLREKITPVAADNVILSDRAAFFEVFPRSDGYANAVLVAPAAAVTSIRTLAQDFSFIVEKSHYSRAFEQPPSGEILQGIIPVGAVKSTALDRILFFGEAGQLHPAATGTCLTRLLLQYKAVTEAIVNKVRSDKLRASDLRAVTFPLGRFAARFHQNIFLELTRLTSSYGDRFVEILGCLDQDSINDFIFGDISPVHFMDSEKLIKLVRKRNFVWLRALMRTFFT